MRTFRGIDFQGNALGVSGASSCSQCAMFSTAVASANRLQDFPFCTVCHKCFLKASFWCFMPPRPPSQQQQQSPELPEPNNLSAAWFGASPWSECQRQINVPLRRRRLHSDNHLPRQEAGVKTGRPLATRRSCFSLRNGRERTMRMRFMTSHMSGRRPEGLFVC